MFECFHTHHQLISDTGPSDPLLYYSEAEIKDYYAELKIIDLSENYTQSFREDVGNHPARTLQFVGLKNQGAL